MRERRERRNRVLDYNGPCLLVHQVGDQMNKVIRRRRATWTVGAAALSTALLVGAFSIGGIANAATSKVALKGTVTVMALGVYSSPEFTVPQALDGVLLAAKQINAAGGIGGKKLVVITCNEDNSASVAAQCAQKAVSDHVAALVGRTTLNGDAVVPIIQKAQIPDIAPIPFSPADIAKSNTVSFVISTTGTPGTVGATVALQKEGCKTIGNVYLSPGANAELPAFNATVKALGLTNAGTFPVEETSPQWSPAFQDAMNAGGSSTCLVTISAAAFDPAEYQALTQTTDPTVKIAAYDNTTPFGVAATLGSAIENTSITSGFKFLNTAAAKPFVSAFDKAYPKATLDAQAENAYIGTEIFAQVASKLKTVTSKTVLAALRTDKKVTNPLLLGTLNFSAPNAISTYSRQFNTLQNAIEFTSPTTAKPLFGGKTFNIETFLKDSAS